ncbi:MAG: hypothetical protein ACJ76Z_14960 [Thermoleophilaceae bacterium]
MAAALAIGAGFAGAYAGHASAARAATVRAAGSPLGRIVVDGSGHTLYLFEKDKRGRSACFGPCATVWPPLMTSGKATAGTGAKASMVGVIRRAGGSHQVTYNGHPLYRYAGDTRPGQTNGEGLRDYGAGWYVVAPSGKKIDRD